MQGRLQQAERYLLRALAIVMDVLGGAGKATGVLNALAITDKDAGRCVEAGALYRQVLARFGARSAAAATSFHNLAGLAHA